MAIVMIIAIVAKSCAVMPLSMSAFIEPAIAVAVPSAICVSYCNEPTTDRRIAGKAMPSVPARITTPSAMPSPGNTENEAEVEITFLIFAFSMPNSFARFIAESI